MDRAERDELIPKYEAEIARLEDNSRLLLKERAGAKWWLVGLVAVPVGFYFHPFGGFAVVFLAVGLWAITLYLTTVRLDERKYELARAREELEKLQGSD